MASRISKGVSGIIRLGQEAYHHDKEKKTAAAQQESSDTTLSELGDEQDEDDWIADDVQDQLHRNQDDTTPETAESTVEQFLSRHPPPQQLHTSRLPAPVVIPQKRPNMRSRGFVKAYAPALAECGVDQTAFLEFLEGFHGEITKHGYFNVSNIAVALSNMAYTLSVAPSVAVHFTAMAVHLSIETGRRMYISKKSNSYIDEINARYFQPRGLYAMIMTYKPGVKDESEVLDFNTAAANSVDKRSNDDKSRMRDWRSSSGKILNQQLPEVCPLVFPELENASPEQKENAFKRSLAFTRDYYDRREQAEFVHSNPDSKLNVQQQQFAGSHGDPSSFKHSGPLGVLTGGRIDPRRRLVERKNMILERRRKSPNASCGRPQLLGENGLVKRTLGDNVLYLMVVNMPSEAELQAAKQVEEKMKREQPNWYEKFMSQGQ